MIFDGHNDTLTRLYADPGCSFFEESSIGQLDLPRAQRGGLVGGFFAIFTPPPPDSPERNPMHRITFTEDGYSVAERSPIDQPYAAHFSDAVIDFAYQLEKESAGSFRIVKSTAEIEQRIADQS